MLRPQKSNLRMYLLLALTLLVTGIALASADGFIARNCQTDHLPGDLIRVVSLAEVFAHGMGVAAIVIGIYILVPQQRRYLPRLIACPLLAGLVATIIKQFSQRARPMAMRETLDSTLGQWTAGWQFEIANNVEKAGYDFESFPSGHAATAFGFAVGMSWLFPRGRWYFFGIAAVAAFQRTSSLAHWTSDVFAGATIGVAVAAIITGSKLGDLCYAWFENRNRIEPEIKLVDSGDANEKIAA